MLKMKLFLLILSSIFIMGCSVATFEHVKLDPSLKIQNNNDEELISRFQEYWENISNKNYQKSYLMELPHHRFEKSFEWYLSFNSSKLKGFKITLLSLEKIDDERAIIKFKYENANGKTATEIDRWVFVNNQWYHYNKLKLLPELNTSSEPF